MIDKDLIELQKGSVATCVVILNEDCKELNPKFVVNSECTDNELLASFKENTDKNDNINYFVVSEIDKLSKDLQDRYYQIVKDREFYGYKLPENMIIVLTVNNKEGLKNISTELYNLCVVAF